MDAAVWLVIAIVVLGYLLLRRALYPNRLCPSCKGEKVIFASDRVHHRPCRRCDGTGHLIRKP